MSDLVAMTRKAYLLAAVRPVKVLDRRGAGENGLIFGGIGVPGGDVAPLEAVAVGAGGGGPGYDEGGVGALVEGGGTGGGLGSDPLVVGRGRYSGGRGGVFDYGVLAGRAEGPGVVVAACAVHVDVPGGVDAGVSGGGLEGGGGLYPVPQGY